MGQKCGDELVVPQGLREHSSSQAPKGGDDQDRHRIPTIRTPTETVALISGLAKLEPSVNLM